MFIQRQIRISLLLLLVFTSLQNEQVQGRRSSQIRYRRQQEVTMADDAIITTASTNGTTTVNGDKRFNFPFGKNNKNKNSTKPWNNATNNMQFGKNLNNAVDFIHNVLNGTENKNSTKQQGNGQLGKNLNNVIDFIHNVLNGTDNNNTNNKNKTGGFFNGGGKWPTAGTNGSAFGNGKIIDTIFGTTNGIIGWLNETKGGILDGKNNSGGFQFPMGNGKIINSILNSGNKTFNWINGTLFQQGNGPSAILGLLLGNITSIFGNNDGTVGIVGILDGIQIIQKATTLQGFVDDWLQDATLVPNKVCPTDGTNNCTSILGNEGFYVCRTLTNPYTAKPSSQNICINKGQYLKNHDICGCCTATGCP